MQEVASKYPQDHEAQIFYALAIAASEDPATKLTLGGSRLGRFSKNCLSRSRSILGWPITSSTPTMYRSWRRGRMVAARRYSEIAPDAPHALHMPSHTFTRTGYWQESIDSNIAAAAAARRDGQTAEELHASDYEIYAYLQTGQDKAAWRIVDSLPEIASRFDPEGVLNGSAGPSVGYFALAAIPARYALEHRDWNQAAQLAVRETPFPYTDAMTWFARGLGAARLGRAQAANQAAAALQQIRERLSKAGENYWAQQVEIQEVHSSGMGCARRRSKRRSPSPDELGSATGRRDREKRGDAWTSGAGARVAG